MIRRDQVTTRNPRHTHLHTHLGAGSKTFSQRLVGEKRLSCGGPRPQVLDPFKKVRRIWHNVDRPIRVYVHHSRRIPGRNNSCLNISSFIGLRERMASFQTTQLRTL